MFTYKKVSYKIFTLVPKFCWADWVYSNQIGLAPIFTVN